MRLLKQRFKFLVHFVVLAGFILPANSVKATTADDYQKAITDQQNQTSQTPASSQSEIDYSTNCEQGTQPFVTGIIKDKNGNPLPNAKVIAKVFGWTATSSNTTSDLSIEATKSDGSYSICDWEGAWSNTYSYLGSTNFFLVITAVPPSDSTGSSMATTLGGTFKTAAYIPPTTPNIDPACILSASGTCKLNVQLRSAVIQGTAKKANGSVLPNANVSLDFKFNGKWTTIGQFLSNKDGWFGFAGFIQNNSFRIRVSPPPCYDDGNPCPYADLGTVGDNFAVTVTGGDPATAAATWKSSGTSSRDFVVKAPNFAGELRDYTGQKILDSVRFEANSDQVISDLSDDKYQDSYVYQGNFGVSLEDGEWTIKAINDGSAIMKDTTFTVQVVSGFVTSVTKGATTVCSAASTPCGTKIQLSLDKPNFIAYVKDQAGNFISNSSVGFERYDAAKGEWPEGWYSRSGDITDQYAPRANGIVSFQLPVDAIVKLHMYAPYSGISDVVNTELTLKVSQNGQDLKIQRCKDYVYGETPCQQGYVTSNVDDASNTLNITNGQFTLVMRSGNFKGVACAPGTGSTCSAVPNGYVQVDTESVPPNCPSCQPYWTSVAGSSVKEDGTFALLVTAGRYRLSVYLPEDDSSTSTLLANSKIEFEAVSDGNDGFNYYLIDSSGNRTDQMLSTTAIANRGTRTIARYATPSILGLVQAPDGTPNRNSYVYVQKDMSTQYCINCRGERQYIRVNNDGIFGASLNIGRYFIQAEPNSDLQSQKLTRVEFKLSALDCNSDGTVELYTYASTACAGATPLTLVNGRVIIELKGANFFGVLKVPGGDTAVSNTGISIEKWETPNGSNMSQWMWMNMYSQTNWNGNFGVTFNEAGKYRVTFRAPYNLQSTYSSSQVVVDVTGTDPLIVTATANSKVWSSDGSGGYIVKLSYPNVSGTVTLPDGTRFSNGQNSWISIEKWQDMYCSSDCYRYSPDVQGVQTSGTGDYALNVPAGRWKLTFNPPYGSTTTAKISKEIVVTEDGAACFKSDAGSQFTTCPSTKILPGEFDVALSTPNVSGTVTLPDGSRYSNGQSSNISIEKWQDMYCGTGCYSYSSEVQGVQTSSMGDYALNVPAGRWKLTFNTPYGLVTAAPISKEIVVTEDGAVCFKSDAGSQFTTCPGAKILPGDFDVSLASPNFSGTVSNPDGTLSKWSSIRFEVLDSSMSYWQWTNLWANTNNEGKFSLNLTENKTYRVTFEPSYNTSGVSALVKYVRVCESGSVTVFISSEENAKTGSSCTGSGTLVSQQISLPGSNIKGIVKDSEGNALADAWINISNCGNGDSNSWCKWERGVNAKNYPVSARGKFDLRLQNSVANGATKYTLEVNPPWNSTTGLVRFIAVVWVKDFNSDSNDDWCLDADYTPGANGGSCASSHGADSEPWAIVLRSGNLGGKVFDPSGVTPISNAQIQVEKWDKPSWDTSGSYYSWQWFNAYAYANQTGSFGLDIKEAGLYRLSVSPGWDNAAGYARKRYFIRVESDGKWCVKSGLTTSSQAYATNSAAPDDDTCVPGLANEPTTLAVGFTARVSTSNLVGTLYTSTTDLSNATHVADIAKKISSSWVTLQYKKPGGWWEWQGGVSTSGSANARGKFAFNITDDGDYKMEFNTPWETADVDAQFSVEFTASNCTSTCEFTGISGANISTVSAGNYLLKYPAPNFFGVVKSKDDSRAVYGSWLSVQNKDTGNWVGGASTGWYGVNAGKFGMKLANGTYRVDVYPRWDDLTGGIRRTLTVKIEGGVVSECGASGCTINANNSLKINLMAETLSGTVKYEKAGVKVTMPWAWAGAMSCSDIDGTNCNDWVDSQSSNQNGLIKFGLADSPNPYLIRVYPNWSLYSGSPLEMLVKVDQGVATWKYRYENSGYQSGDFEPDFSHIPPNVTVTVTGATSSRYVDLYQCDSGSCLTGGIKIATVITADAGTSWKANFLVSASATYRVVVITKSGIDQSVSAQTFTYDKAADTFNSSGSTLDLTYNL